MKGYLNRPEENTKFFGDDGFIHTGDLGSILIKHAPSRAEYVIKNPASSRVKLMQFSLVQKQCDV